MNEQEIKIIQTIAKTLPEMDKEQKAYILGQAEGMAIMKVLNGNNKEPLETKNAG